MTTTAKWEYKIETFGTTFRRPKEFEIQETLNQWGIDGWEVVQYHQPQSSNKITIVAKRPLTGTRQRQSKNWTNEWENINGNSFD